jgi:quinol-cytochrome oxidoreductase complex cytochrome b subunit
MLIRWLWLNQRLFNKTKRNMDDDRERVNEMRDLGRRLKLNINNRFMNTKSLKLPTVVQEHLVDYKMPINLNYMWNWGFIGGVCLMIQIVTGIFLVMHYVPDVNGAFDSVEHIMREVKMGWLIRYMHANGASMFFIIIYIHMLRGIYYGSYYYPREGVWITGVMIYALMMATAFLGYTLVYGQMSLWGSTVITNMITAIPKWGALMLKWLIGGYTIGDATLKRFFSLHYLIPMIILGMVLIHLAILHIKGSNNPTGLSIVGDEWNKKEKTNFYPKYYIKDGLSLIIVLMLLIAIVSYRPNILGHVDNYIKADMMVTPEHIVPEWYFLPFYAILRSIPSKIGGILGMIGAIILLMILPIMERYRIKRETIENIRGPEWKMGYRIWFWIFVACCLILGWVGGKPVEEPYVMVGRIMTIYYYIYMICLIIRFRWWKK